MINLPNNVPYTISFPQGGSGRFAKYLLHNLLTNSNLELYPCPVTNSTHATDDIMRAGTSPPMIEGGNSRSDIWEVFNFSTKTFDEPRILATHIFPDFKLIKERLGANTKCIIITVGADDIVEVIINDRVKNIYDLLNGKSPDPIDKSMADLTKRYMHDLKKYYPGTFVMDDIINIAKAIALDSMPYLINKSLGIPVNPDRRYNYETKLEKYVILPETIDYPEDQVLFLPYSDLYNNWEWLHKLEEFTEKKANKVTYESYQRYLDGRTKMIKQYGIRK